MKRLPKDPEKFGAIKLFDAMGRKYGFGMHDEDATDQFLRNISKSLETHKSNPIVLHGRRSEEMFGFVAASLGKCRLIKQEDEGEVYVGDPQATKIPDYRIVTSSGEEFLVEVKNFYQKKDPTLPYVVKNDYRGKLLQYGGLANRPIKLAIYWNLWNIWTLTDLERLQKSDKDPFLDMYHAMKWNEMATLGDATIGTKSPLTFRLTADPTKKIELKANGEVFFITKSAELRCNGTLIENENEKGVAFYLMLYGRWPAEGPALIATTGKPQGVEWRFEPVEPKPDSEFEMAGTLSGMIARQFDQLTVSEGAVERLTPANEPGSLGLLIEENYRGEQLPLWRFTVQPNYKDD